MIGTYPDALYPECFSIRLEVNIENSTDLVVKFVSVDFGCVHILVPRHCAKELHDDEPARLLSFLDNKRTSAIPRDSKDVRLHFFQHLVDNDFVVDDPFF